MDGRMYPNNRIMKSRWDGGVLKFFNASGNEVWSIDPVNRRVSGPGIARTLRTRLAIAAINAGATLIAAKAGYKYRLISATAIAYGGAVAAVTTVDLKGVSTSIRKLVAFGQAQLTQSSVVKDGETGGTVLADAASYTENDANTAITVDITGSDITTATGIDFSVTYEEVAS